MHLPACNRQSVKKSELNFCFWYIQLWSAMFTTVIDINIKSSQMLHICDRNYVFVFSYNIGIMDTMLGPYCCTNASWISRLLLCRYEDLDDDAESPDWEYCDVPLCPVTTTDTATPLTTATGNAMGKTSNVQYAYSGVPLKAGTMSPNHQSCFKTI